MLKTILNNFYWPDYYVVPNLHQVGYLWQQLVWGKQTVMNWPCQSCPSVKHDKLEDATNVASILGFSHNPSLTISCPGRNQQETYIQGCHWRVGMSLTSYFDIDILTKIMLIYRYVSRYKVWIPKQYLFNGKAYNIIKSLGVLLITHGNMAIEHLFMLLT